MEFENNRITLEKELSELDKEVLEFVEILESLELSYVIVSGYVAILLGRSRGSEDIDVLIDLGESNFENFWKRLEEENYWCINAGREEAFDMLEDGLSVRFAKEGEVIPNFELKLPETEFDHVALDSKWKASVSGKEINISPLELQIVYKLHLGSDKDFEDALHIYKVAKESLNGARLDDIARALEVKEELGELETEAAEREE